MGRLRRAPEDVPKTRIGVLALRCAFLRGHRLFDSIAEGGSSPQKSACRAVHTLGTGELSRLYPQRHPVRDHRRRSGGCGFVDKRSPQAVDDARVHSGPNELSTGGPQAEGGCPQLLHMAVHCSATQRALSPGRVKAVTPRCSVGLWGTRVKLGTALGRSRPVLCTGCAELFAVHSEAGLSTAVAHRLGGQNLGPDLLKRGYPRFPQPLLLPLPR